MHGLTFYWNKTFRHSFLRLYSYNSGKSEIILNSTFLVFLHVNMPTVLCEAVWKKQRTDYWVNFRYVLQLIRMMYMCCGFIHNILICTMWVACFWWRQSGVKPIRLRENLRTTILIIHWITISLCEQLQVSIAFTCELRHFHVVL